MWIDDRAEFIGSKDSLLFDNLMFNELSGLRVPLSPQDDMRGLLLRYEFHARISQNPQVDPFEQRLSPAEQERRDSNVQFINEAFTEILADGVRPTADPYVHANCAIRYCQTRHHPPPVWVSRRQR